MKKPDPDPIPRGYTSPERLENELELDQTLRPARLEEFVGQGKIVENLRVFISAAKQRSEPLDHVLLRALPDSARPRWHSLSQTKWGLGLR